MKAAVNICTVCRHRKTDYETLDLAHGTTAHPILPQRIFSSRKHFSCLAFSCSRSTAGMSTSAGRGAVLDCNPRSIHVQAQTSSSLRQHLNLAGKRKSRKIRTSNTGCYTFSPNIEIASYKVHKSHLQIRPNTRRNTHSQKNTAVPVLALKQASHKSCLFPS